LREGIVIVRPGTQTLPPTPVSGALRGTGIVRGGSGGVPHGELEKSAGRDAVFPMGGTVPLCGKRQADIGKIMDLSIKR